MTLKRAILFSAGPLTGCVGWLPETGHDLGGVTFDFVKMSEARFPDVTVGRSKGIVGPRTKTGGNADGCEVISKMVTRTVALPHARGGKYRIVCTSRVLPKKAGDVAVMIRFGTASLRVRERMETLQI